MSNNYKQCFYLTDNKQLYCLHRDKRYYSVTYNCQYYSFGVNKWIPANVPSLRKEQEISQEEAFEIINESKMIKELHK